jgi:hypothetical protein
MAGKLGAARRIVNDAVLPTVGLPLNLNNRLPGEGRDPWVDARAL